MMMVLNYGVAGKHKEIELYGENVTPLFEYTN